VTMSLEVGLLVVPVPLRLGIRRLVVPVTMSLEVGLLVVPVPLALFHVPAPSGSDPVRLFSPPLDH
jgi:hypothetical protein